MSDSSSVSVGGGRAQPEHIQETEFWNVLMHDIYGPRKGGAIIFLDAENARKGVAKTSGAVAFARLLSRAFQYKLVTEDLTLSGSEYLKRYQEHPGYEQPSVLVLDEFVGAGAGDKRRSMAQQNVDFGRAWQLLRTKRVVTIATLPDWNDADKRLKKLADFRIRCLEKPIGTFQAYKVVVPFNSAGGRVHTMGLGQYTGGTQRILFPNMDAENDKFYHTLSKKKDELIHSSTWDADDLLGEDGEPKEEFSQEEVERREAIRYAIKLYEPWNNENSRTYNEISSVIDNYSMTWVANRMSEWRDGEHRDLVPDPTEDEE